MGFQALLVSKDEAVAATLTPVLSGFGVGAQSCSYSEALCRVAEQKYDAVIIDFDDPHSAALVLQTTEQASAGNAAITIALLSDKTKVRNVFGAGANFVLYKPISAEQAQATLRAATALIKRETPWFLPRPGSDSRSAPGAERRRDRRHPAGPERGRDGSRWRHSLPIHLRRSPRISRFLIRTKRLKSGAKLPGRIPMDNPAYASLT